MTGTLLRWFYQHQRDLPWRRERTPYRVWVSEVMLQQTQVRTVIPFFERWLKRFPHVSALAEAPLDEVLKAWEGLGYYRRARLLHAGAQEVAKDYEGHLPERYEELLGLPGVGTYTAAAIASLAFGEDVLAVDGNVKRVAARLFALPGVVAEKEAKKTLLPHLPRGQAGAFNEALMELGATVCTPKSPLCSNCPISKDCLAFQRGDVSSFPEPKKKKKVPHVKRYALVYERGDSLCLRQRSQDEMLGGLWGFPLVDDAPTGERLEEVQHAYTHFKITVTPVLVEDEPEQSEAISPTSLPELALSKLDHKILDTLRERNAQLETQYTVK